jgi:hypothetical protein
MKRMLTLAIAACAAALTAAASNNSMAGDIASHAQRVQADAQAVSSSLKAKSFDRQAVLEKSAAIEENIEKLRELAASFEVSTPSLSASQQKSWELVKTKIELLHIFSNQKKALLDSGDLAKNRSWVRAHAEGIAKRAALLQKTASSL